MMGSSISEPDRNANEGMVHRVTIGYDLAVGKFEVTQGQWKAVMGSNPSHFKDCGDNCPVENVSWNDAQDYLKKLNARAGQRYRLLSEAEWEYAARAGTTTPFHTGETITPQQANFDGNSTYNGSAKGTYRQKTVAAGSFAPNGFGLHDMHGNVWEWVQDLYHENYTGAPVDGSAWESGGDASRRVLRGGSWYSFPRYWRSAVRSRSTPDSRDGIAGFRIARTF
jgi:formylglycine-generating enzyme required for sulfatase activity